ncbi:MAG: UvrB/UvrC motif-containing protein [Lachnospiraceae bacterium]|nr:UvrB/UvrC motif-containing protein [Lachnospiraceae bacterium]
MLCQACRKKQANTHIKNIVNGELTELLLCSDCAEKMGYGMKLTNMFDLGSLGSLMSGIMGEATTSALAAEQHCPKCGSTFSSIAKSGWVGCSECYNVFYDRLLPSIKKIHGNTIHTGKKSSAANNTEPQTSAVSNKVNRSEQLKAKLKDAIDAQEFERAAELRDLIKELEQGGM